MPKRNWAAIARLDDYHTRVAVSLATDPEILACYERGFPHLFMEGDDEGPLHIPLSVLMQAAEEHSRREFPAADYWRYDRHFCLGFAGDLNSDLKIPHAYHWCEEEVPDFVVEQLVGQKAQAGMVVEVDGKKYVVGGISFSGKYEHPEIGAPFEEPPCDVDGLYLFDADFISLDK